LHAINVLSEIYEFTLAEFVGKGTFLFQSSKGFGRAPAGRAVRGARHLAAIPHANHIHKKTPTLGWGFVFQNRLF